MSKVKSLLSEVNKALEKVGTHNGTAPLPSQDPADVVMHEYYVATIGEAFFKKRRDNAKKALIKACDTYDASSRLSQAVADTVRTEMGATVNVGEAENFATTVDIRNGATYTDMVALQKLMAHDHGISQMDFEAAVERATLRRTPAQSWKVSTK